MNEKTKPSEFKIKVNAADFEEYQNEESKKDSSQEYDFGALVLIPNTKAAQATVKLIILKTATEKYETEKEPIEVEILVEAVSWLTPFLNKEALNEIEEGRGIEFMAFTSTSRKELVMTWAKIKLVLPPEPETKD